MEAGLRISRIGEVDRTWRLYRGLYEVAEVAFLRAGSHGRALCRFLTQPPPLSSLPFPFPGRATLATPASAEAES